MANEEIILRIKTMMDSGDVKGAVSQMQSYFDKLKPSDQVRGDFDKLFKDLIKEADQFETRVQGSFDKIGDVNSLKKVGNNISTIFSKIIKEFNKISGSNVDLSQFFDIDTSKVTQVTKQIDQLKNKLSSVTATKIDDVEQSFNELLKTSKRAQGSNFFASFKSGDLDQASADFEQLSRHLTGFGTKSDKAKQAIRTFLSLLNSGEISSAKANITELMRFGGAAGADSKLVKYANALVDIAEKLQQAKQESGELTNKIEQLDAQKVEMIANAMQEAATKTGQFKNALNTADQGFDRVRNSANQAAASVQSFQSEVQELGSRATYFLSLENSVDLFRRGIQKALETVKELDKAMTETAVVTDFTVGDMWEKLPEYSQMAKELGVEIRGVYEASTLYYQQGLQTEQVMALTTETLKMARIAGLECSDATNLMTAALRGFNMEINEVNAQRINDVYSELAAITAADTNEIATAMTKTASIASSANMELETTAALLAQMIETTREPAETAGTAMKTIIARFTEMKKATSDIVSVEGEEISVNKVEEALRSAGVALRDLNGEFRDGDDVLIELASKWDSLDIMTQRYVATMAAGSRQQSRFIAMMQNYDRTMELVDAAYNSSGASAKQFNKTQESLQSILARLSVAWETFLMGIADDQIIKGFVKVLTKLLETFNKITEGADGIGGSIGRLIAVFGGLRLANAGVKGLMKYFVGLKSEITGTSTKLTFFQALLQRINNFKLGKGFHVDATVDTAGFTNKINHLKSEWSSFTTGLQTAPVMNFTGFEQLENGMIGLQTTSIATGKTITTELSASGAAALMASKSADEFADELREGGLNGKIAQDAIQKEIMETMALLEAAEKQQATYDSTPRGNMSKRQWRDFRIKKAENAKKITGYKNKIGDLKTDSANLGKVTEKTTGSMSAGFKALLPVLGKVAIVLAAIAAVAAVAYLAYEASPLKKAKDEAELAETAVQNYGRAIEKCREEQEELNGLLDALSEQQTVLDGLIKGSVEWYTAIQNNNAALLEQIEMLESLGYDVDYSYNASGQIEIENTDEFRQAQKEIADRELALVQGEKAAISYSRVANQKADAIADNSKKESDAFWNGMLDGAFSGDTLSAAIDAAGVGFALGTTIGFATGGVHAGLMATGGAAISFVSTLLYGGIEEGIQQSTDAITEYSKEGFYAEMTLDQKEALDLEAQKAAISAWIDIAENDEQIKAGQKVIENLENAAEVFYSPEAFSNRYPNLNFETEFGHEVLQYKGKEIDDEDLGTIIKELGFNNWTEAAQSIGLNYDTSKSGADGLYIQNEDDTKTYLDVRMHGQIDTTENWDAFLSDPSEGGFDNGKDIDAGFLALLLAEAASTSKNGVIGTLMREFLSGEQVDQVLYGTEDWGDHTKDYTKDILGQEKTGLDKAVGQAINEANNRRREIFNSLYDTKFENGDYVFGEQNRGLMEDLSGYIQRLEVDKNTQTALAFQNFMTQQQGIITRQQQLEKGGSVRLLERPQIDASKLVEAGWTEAGEGVATVYSSTFSNEDGTVAMNFTPILPNGEVLSPEELEEYANNVINGAVDTKGLKIGATFEGENAVQEASQVAEEIHNLQEEYYANGFSADQVAEYYDLFSKLDVTDAVGGLNTLNQEIERGSEEAEKLKNLFTQRGGAFDLSHQFEDLLTSGVLDEISEEISKLSNEAGNIDVTATRELIDSNTALKNIMDDFNVSGYAMGKILSDIQKGELTLTDINKGLVESYKLLYSAMGQAEDVLYDLKKADLGDDYTEIGRIYEERYNTIKDLYKRKAYGSENFGGNIASLVGQEAWDQALLENDNNSRLAWEAIQKQYALNKNNGNLYGSMSTLISRGATDSQGRQIFSNQNGKIAYDLSGFNTYDEVLDHMVEAFGVSREYAKAMLADMATYSETLQNDLNDLNAVANANEVFNSMYREGATETDPGTSYTNLSDKELANVFGKTKQWADAIEKAKKETKDWDLLSVAEQTDKIAEAFKNENEIINTITVNGKKQKIEKIDSQGNKYYRDDNGKLVVSPNENNTGRKHHFRGETKNEDGTTTMNYESNAIYGEKLKNDQKVQAMAIELNDEEFSAWLDYHTGEDNAIQIFADVGVTRESLASIAMARDEFLTQIGGVVEALKQVEVVIPVSIPNELLSILGRKELTEGYTHFKIKIGGEDTAINYAGTENSAADLIATSAANYNKFTSRTTNPSGTGYDGGSDEDNGDGNGGDKDKEKTEKLSAFQQELNDLKEKESDLEAAINDLQDNQVYNAARVVELLKQKRAVQKDYLAKLRQENAIRKENEKYHLSEAKKEGYDKYFKKDEETGLYELTERFYSELFTNGVAKDSEKVDEIMSLVDKLNEVAGGQLQTELEIERLVEELTRDNAENYNAERKLIGTDRRQNIADREEELIGRLPEEIQGPLLMANSMEDAWIEYDTIQANRTLIENKSADLQKNYESLPEEYKQFLDFNEFDGFTIDEESVRSQYSGQEATDMLDALEQLAIGYNEDYDEIYELKEEISGGKIQKAFHSISKVSKEFAKDLRKDEKTISKAFRELGEDIGFGADQLEGFGFKVEELIGDMDFKGITDEETAEKITDKIGKSKIGQDIFSEEGLTGIQQLLTGGKGNEMLGAFGDVFGDLMGFGGDMLSFDMMNIGLDMFDNAKNMIDQGKQMIEKIVGYITQATQVIVDAWTNREDYLYNFLQIIEKHLNEYEKLQRYQNQLEKGRTSTVEEIRANYDAQWKSLQQQLEEQQERLETRQEELNRSRWNPFSLISGWDPSSDTLYENRSVKFAWDLIIGFGEAFAPFGTGAFFSQLNQLYEDYDKRVQQSYEDRLAAEQALIDIEDQRLELVKYGSEEATEFESKILEAMIQKEQEQIDELTRLNDAITDANSKLISTLQDNLDKMRQDRENEKKEEELSEKERRLAYLRQDTSGANMLEIKKLEEQLEEEHEDYTDTLIDQKISELEKQNELAAEQRQQQIDLLQSQLDYAEKYGLYWDAIYGMLYTIDENGNAVLNPENFDLDGNIRENSQLAQMLGTFSDRLGMSVWSAVLDNEEMKHLGRYYGFFIGNNGVTGNWRHQWALDNPGADDPNFAYPDQEIPEGLWGVLYKLEIFLRERSINNNPDLLNRAGRTEQAFKNFFGKLFGNEEWANYKHEAVNPSRVQSTTFAGMKKLSDDTKEWFKSLFSSNESYGNKTSRNLTGNGAQNIGDINTTNYFQIGNVGETVSLDDMVDRVAEKFKDMFSIGNNILGRNRT